MDRFPNKEMKRMKSLFTAIGLALSSTLTMAAGSEATATYVGNADQGKAKSATCALIFASPALRTEGMFVEQ